jgi:hypothetical protein
LVGFYDPNQENADKISRIGYKHFSTIATLIHAVDVIDIVTQLFHYNVQKLPSNQANTFLSKTHFKHH